MHELSTINKNIFANPAKKNNIKGRPSGGLAFIVDKSFKSKVKHLNERISILILGSLILVNVYLIHGGKEINNLEFESDFYLVESIYEQYQSDKHKVIILGYFITDMKRKITIVTS